MNEKSALLSWLGSKEFSEPTHAQSGQKKKQRRRVSLFDAVHLRQDIGGGDCQKRSGRNADSEGDIFRCKAAKKKKASNAPIGVVREKSKLRIATVRRFHPAASRMEEIDMLSGIL